MGGLLIGALVLAAVLTFRSRGLLQFLELRIYDQLVRIQRGVENHDNRIVICGMTEGDLRKYGHPIDDFHLSQLLEALAAQRPCIIGLDIYRDLPEPRSGENHELLEATLKRLDNVIAIERLPLIPPPSALAGQLDRVSPNNLPMDDSIDGRHRRAYLFLEQGLSEPRGSFALSLALAYLESHQVSFDLRDRGKNAPQLQLGSTILPRLSPDAGGYVALPISDYETLIDYRIHSTFDWISFDDVLTGEIEPGRLRDKIVLVGVAAETVKDYIPTPIGNVRGVLHWGTLIRQLLLFATNVSQPILWWPEFAELTWIALWVFTGAFLGLRLRSPLLLAPALLGLVGTIIIVASVSLLRNVWIPSGAAMVGGIIAATFASSLAAFLERADRRVLSDLFFRHVSPPVATWLWDQRDELLEGGRLKPKRVTATVLFTDLKNFSTTSEGMDPGDLLAWLNELLTVVTGPVERQGGVINKFLGDGIMAIFGVPLAAVDAAGINADAVRSVECALEMRRDLSVLNASLRERGLPTTGMRIGIYTGELIAGSIGSERRLEFSVLGDTVNTASRLESAGKSLQEDSTAALDCTILVGDATYRRLGEAYSAECLGSMPLKGKSNSVTVYRINHKID